MLTSSISSFGSVLFLGYVMEMTTRENIGHESAQLSAPKSMALTIAMLHVIQMMFIDTDCHATYTTNDVYRTTSPYRDTNFPHPTQK